MSTVIAEELKEIGTTTLSDALDRLGIEGQCLGIKPFAHQMRLAGPAFTIRMLPVGVHGGGRGLHRRRRARPDRGDRQ